MLHARNLQSAIRNQITLGFGLWTTTWPQTETFAKLGKLPMDCYHESKYL